MRAFSVFVCVLSFVATVIAAFFPVGVWYGGGKYRAPTISRDPLAERSAWLSDLQSIKAVGFSMVKTWVDWASTESTQGVFDFTALQQLLDLANQTGLRVLVQIYADSAPDWVASTYPEAEFVTETSLHIHSQSAPGPCQDNSGPRQAVGRFYQEVAKVASQSPMLYGYDVWSEPTLVNWVWFNDLPDVQFCYCNASISRFTSWLQKKYGTLENLNQAWYRTFSSWNQVQPPRFGTILSYTDYMDFRQFTAKKLAEDLAFYTSMIRSVDPNHIITSHSASPSVISSFPVNGYGLPDDWLMSPVVDYYGSSIYPKHVLWISFSHHPRALAPMGGRSPSEVAFMYDGAYSASRGRGCGRFVGELQAGQGVTGVQVNVPVTPDDQERWMWQALAHGAKSISIFSWYYMNQGYEAGGYGLVPLSGNLTDRAMRTGAVASAIARNADLLLSALPRPAQWLEVAILFNPLSYLCGGNTVGPATSVTNNLISLYNAFYELNMPVEFVHVDDAVRGALVNYTVVYAPFPVTQAQNVSAALRAYVQGGGSLISEARMAWTDENGFTSSTIPGAGLDQVFGVSEAVLLPIPDGTSVVINFTATAPYGLSGISFPAQVFAEGLTVLRGSVLATLPNALPAIVSSTYGSGRTLYLGTFLGLSAAVSSAAASAFQKLLLGWGNVSPPVSVTCGGKTVGGAQVEVRVSSCEGGHICTALNNAAYTSTDCTITIANLQSSKCLDIVNQTPLACSVSGSSTRLAISFGPSNTNAVVAFLAD